MLNRTIVSRLAFGCALLVSVLASAALAGGPPWISVEMPGDPTNPASRGAVMLVHAYSCGGPTPKAVTGTAEGIVKGERKTIALTLESTGATGVYAVKKQWPSEGTWVLAFSMSIGGEVSTLVTLGPNGGVESSEYHKQPSAVVKATSVQVLARKSTAADVDTLLRAATAGDHPTLAVASAGSTSASALGYLAGGFGLMAFVMGSAATIVWRRRR
jgi:hypothetical protein